ncbi:hypothetical protein T09_3058 [Trichinella sp. T9]|nr:hypothetical protein T09_1409 [Trichinella sp. T9]KRX46386.1 hypothetical protein T09_3058 [Trichinella sp. T9]
MVSSGYVTETHSGVNMNLCVHGKTYCMGNIYNRTERKSVQSAARPLPLSI